MSDELVRECVARLRREEPFALAVLLTGSHVRGEAGEFSDLDLTLLTRERPRIPYRAWLLERPNGSLRHVSTSAEQWDEWREDANNPAEWSWYLPAREIGRVLWADEAVREELADPTRQHPPGSIELEDFLECAGKVKNAEADGSSLALRLAAQNLARYCPAVLRPINPEVVVRYPYEALEAVLAFPVAPPGYREDMFTCLGLQQASTEAEVYGAAIRLAIGVVQLLSERVDQFREEIEPDLSLYLEDGRLLRYLRQGVEAEELSQGLPGW